MKRLNQSIGMLAMVLMLACDETTMEEVDASSPASCVLYASPDTDVDGGDGESEDSPLSSGDSVISKTSALKSHCKDSAEVRFADGSLSDEQFGIAADDLKSRGIKVGTYSLKAEGFTADPSSNNNVRGIQSINTALPDDRRLFDSFPGISFNPAGVQDMTSRSDTTADYYSVTGASPYYKWDSTDSTFVDWVAQSSSGNLYIRRSAAAGSGTTGERLVFRSSSTPKSAVEISGFENDGSGDGNGILRLYKGTSTTTPMIVDNNEIDSYDTAGLHLNNNSTQAVYIAGNTGSANYVYMARGTGRVAIGNLTSAQTTHKLTVDGGIKAEEIVVDTVGADFVFENDYDLMSLDEVSSFVEENHHLPGIASADEMKSDGLPMGEFQIQLLQKVEELTLYAIEQNERTMRLEEENNRLKNMLENISGVTK